MAADGPGGGAGRVEQNRVERATVEGQRVADGAFGLQPGAAEVLLQRLHALLRPVEGDDPRSRRGELHRLAARRRAHVEDALARRRRQQSRRQRGGRVLHPPCAVVVSGQPGDPSGIRQPHRSGRQQRSAERLRQRFGVGLGGQIERGAGAVRDLHRRDRPDAPGLRQRTAQPCGQARRPQILPRLGAVLGDLAQHRVDEAALAPAAPAACGECDQIVDHAVGVSAPAQLGRSQPQDVAQPRRRAAPRMPVDQPVRPLQPAQGVVGEAHRLRASGRVESLRGALAHGAAQALSAPEGLVEHVHGGAAGGWRGGAGLGGGGAVRHGVFDSGWTRL